MSEIRVICTNTKNNVSIEFSYEDNATFFIVDLDAFHRFENNAVSSENTTTDGATYQGSTLKERYPVITASMDSNYQENRDILYKCFAPKSTGEIKYIEGSEERIIKWDDIDNLDIDPTGVIRNITISFKCTDPFFKDPYDTTVTMAGWEGGFEFDHEFPEDGEEFGSRKAEIIKEIDNDSAANNIGMEILMAATGNVTNPAIYHIEEDEFVKVLMSLKAGEAIRITTETNNKTVYYIDNTGKETEVNAVLDEESEFIQIVSGKNTLKYDAESGIEYLDVTITYKFRYVGV